MGTKKGTTGTGPRTRDVHSRARRAADKLSVEETVRTSETDDVATAHAWLALVEPINGTFADVTWTLRQVEKSWQQHALTADDLFRVAIGDQPPPETHSAAWFADRILTWIARAREAYASKDVERLGLNMFQVARLHEEARWRLAFAPTERYMRKVRANSLRAVRRRVREGRVAASKRDARVIALHQELRAKHVRDPQHSTSWLAREIARRTNQKVETERARLQRLGLT
jgi:hypothetical protein